MVTMTGVSQATSTRKTQYDLTRISSTMMNATARLTFVVVQATATISSTVLRTTMTTLVTVAKEIQ